MTPARTISTHALREEGDLHDFPVQGVKMEFLPTPSVRRATKWALLDQNRQHNFYPRPP